MLPFCVTVTRGVDWLLISVVCYTEVARSDIKVVMAVSLRCCGRMTTDEACDKFLSDLLSVEQPGSLEPGSFCFVFGSALYWFLG